jgi:hypothetical protein
MQLEMSLRLVVMVVRRVQVVQAVHLQVVLREQQVVVQY